MTPMAGRDGRLALQPGANAPVRGRGDRHAARTCGGSADGRGVAVFSVNPKQLDRFRDRFSPAGAKDDRRDALVLTSSLKTDRHCFRRLEPLDPLIVELREWSRMADELKDERTRLTNRIRQQLWRYYPQALELGDDVGAERFLDLLEVAPTPDTARRLTEKRIGQILSSYRIRHLSAGDVLSALRRPALSTNARVRKARPNVRRLSQMGFLGVALAVSARLPVADVERDHCVAPLVLFPEALTSGFDDVGGVRGPQRAEGDRIVLAVLLVLYRRYRGADRLAVG